MNGPGFHPVRFLLVDGPGGVQGTMDGDVPNDPAYAICDPRISFIITFWSKMRSDDEGGNDGTGHERDRWN